MLDKLDAALKLLPSLLDKREAWDSLIVNRRKPFTYRVFTYLPDGLRICLHKQRRSHGNYGQPDEIADALGNLRGLSYQEGVKLAGLKSRIEAIEDFTKKVDAFDVNKSTELKKLLAAKAQGDQLLKEFQQIKV